MAEARQHVSTIQRIAQKVKRVSVFAGAYRSPPRYGCVMDRVVRAISDDGAFRVIAAVTTATVAGVAAAQRVEGDVAVRLGSLVTAAVLVRETMAPDLRVQMILGNRAGGRTRLVADSHPDGTSRGLVQGVDDGFVPFLDRLQVMRTIHNGGLQQGIVEVDGEGIADALMEYMRASEQSVTFAAIAASPSAAGGWLVQLTPECTRDALALITERIERQPPIEKLLADNLDPERVIADLLVEVPFTRTGDAPLRFGCNCSDERLIIGLATLPREDLRHLAEGHELLEIQCDYCLRDYRISPDRLRGLLEPN